MGFIGLIRLIALLLAVWLVWRFVMRRNAKSNSDSEKRIDQKVVQCAVCGTHVPESEALSKNGASYCSREHLALSERDDDSEH